MNREQDPMDLAALDPSRDGARWERMVQSVAARARAARQRKLTIGRQMLAWGGPALAVAAALALVAWAGALARESSSSRDTMTAQEPAYVLSSWAANDERPEPSEILTVLGERYGSN